MPELVVYLFEPVEVAQQDSKRSSGTLDAGEFFFKMQTNRSGVGQSSEVIGAGGALSLFVLEGIFHGKPEFGARCQEQAQMILGEAISLAMVKRKHAGDAVAATKGDAQGRLQGCDSRGSAEMESFSGGVAIGYWVFVARHPTRKTLNQGNKDGCKKNVVHPMRIFRNKRFT